MKWEEINTISVKISTWSFFTFLPLAMYKAEFCIIKSDFEV